MPRANWVRVAEQIANQLRRLPGNQSLSMTIEELSSQLGGVERVVSSKHDTWDSIQRGTPEWNAVRKAGLVVNFWPDATGTPVKQVTFRLDRLRESNDEG